MREITIEEIVDKPLKLYSPSGDFIGELPTMTTFMDVTAKLKKRKQAGYIIVDASGNKHTLDANGDVDGEAIPATLFPNFLKVLETLTND